LYVFPALALVLICACVAIAVMSDSYDDPDENNFDNS